MLLRTTTVVFVIDENEFEVVRYPLPLEVIFILFIEPFAAACWTIHCALESFAEIFLTGIKLLVRNLFFSPADIVYKNFQR